MTTDPRPDAPADATPAAEGRTDKPQESPPEVEVEPGEATGEPEAALDEATGDAQDHDDHDDHGDEDGDRTAATPAPGPGRARRRRNRIAAGLIGVLTLLLGFAFAVQVRTTDSTQKLSTAREEDLVGVLDTLNDTETRLRNQIADQQAALDQLTGSDTRSTTALSEARSRAASIGILNGTLAAQGPGLRMVIRDPGGSVRVADLLDAIEELRGAGAETMQVDDVRVGVDTAVTGSPGALRLDDIPLRAPYEVLVIGSPQDLETAMNIPGGVVQRITGQGGSVDITQEQQVVVDALRPLQQPQYAAPKTGG